MARSTASRASWTTSGDPGRTVVRMISARASAALSPMARATSTASSASGSQSLPPPIQSMTCTSPETTTPRSGVGGSAGTRATARRALTRAASVRPLSSRNRAYCASSTPIRTGSTSGSACSQDRTPSMISTASTSWSQIAAIAAARENTSTASAPTRLSASGTDGHSRRTRTYCRCASS